MVTDNVYPTIIPAKLQNFTRRNQHVKNIIADLTRRAVKINNLNPLLYHSHSLLKLCSIPRYAPSGKK